MTFPRPRELGEHVGGKDGLVAQYMLYISNSIVNNLKIKNKRWGGTYSLQLFDKKINLRFDIK